MEAITIVYTGSGDRIDKFLVPHLDEYTRTQIQGMIKNNEILVNEDSVKANYILKEGDQINILPNEPIDSTILPENIPLNIVYEDADLLVVNKPSGMVVHPAPGNYTGTLVNALLYHCQDLSGINGVIRAGIVHRIDKDTSGLLVVCKNDYTHKKLSLQFANKEVSRKYYAICSGVIMHNQGKINAPIGRDHINRQQMAIVENGKNAITNFTVIERFKNHTFIECVLETGRTHQIRVHMKYIGFPITGDPVYGYKHEIVPTGQYLHAKTLGFMHPRLEKYMEFDSPLPDYFQDYLNTLSKEEK